MGLFNCLKICTPGKTRYREGRRLRKSVVQRKTWIEQEGSEAGIPLYTLCSMSKGLVFPIPVSVTCDAYINSGKGLKMLRFLLQVGSIKTALL